MIGAYAHPIRLEFKGEVVDFGYHLWQFSIFGISFFVAYKVSNLIGDVFAFNYVTAYVLMATLFLTFLLLLHKMYELLNIYEDIVIFRDVIQERGDIKISDVISCESRGCKAYLRYKGDYGIYTRTYNFKNPVKAFIFSSTVCEIKNALKEENCFNRIGAN